MVSDSDRHRKISELFGTARPLTAHEQSKLLDRECATDPDLRREIELLLDSDRRAASFLQPPDSPPISLPPTESPTSAATALIGRRLGSWQLLRVIAAGGMGTVYEALQDRPEQHVAVKVLRRGLLSPSARRRFEYESEILGRLRHPGIAQVLAAGTWGDADQAGVALPYFVLELVPDARPLTTWCRERQLDLAARLDLFVQVCEAVHHGHQKGVIHRDLKPANVLVDGQGRPKVIDFGIARATDADLALTTQHTQAGELLGTLQYMSPEQCGDAPDDLDVRTDVYALGVILYELVTGALPYDVADAPLAVALERVRTAVPVRPSQRDRALRGDLETIVLKALAKEKGERYASAADLARDLVHFRRHEPIEARPPSALYVLRKFVRRNRLLVAASLVTLAGLGVGLVVATHGLDQAKTALAGKEQESRVAKRQARIADMTSSFLRKDLLGAAMPKARGRAAPIGLLLDAAAASLPSRFLDEPLVASRLHFTLGLTFDELGDFASARTQYEAATARIDGLAEVDDASRRERVWIQIELAKLLEPDRALALVAEMRTVVDRLFGAESAESAALLAIVGGCRYDEGRFEESLAARREALRLFEITTSADSQDVLAMQVEVAASLKSLRQFADAERLLLSALQALEKSPGPTSPETLNAMNNLGVLYGTWGRFEDALRWYQDALPRFERVMTPDHPETLLLRANLACTLDELGEHRKAGDMFAEVVPRLREKLGDDSLLALKHAVNWGHALRKCGSFDESLDVLETASEGIAKSFGDDHAARLYALRSIAKVHEQRGSYDEARSVYDELIGLEDSSDRVSERERLITRLDYAYGTLVPTKAYAEAEPLLKDVFDRQSRIDGEQNRRVQVCAELLAQIYRETGRPELAAEWDRTAQRCAPPPAKEK